MSCLKGLVGPRKRTGEDVLLLGAGRTKVKGRGGCPSFGGW